MIDIVFFPQIPMPGSPEMNDMTAALEGTDLPTDAMVQAELAKLQTQIGGQAKMDIGNMQ